MGWLVVAFDLPVVAPEQRKAAVRFRDSLLDDGFKMIQYSVYARPCVSFARQETHLRRVRVFTPPEGNIRSFFITRAQWDRGYVINGSPARLGSPEKFPEQIQLW